jgi:peptidyl-prolyl cis-trans isomerase SurA
MEMKFVRKFLLVPAALSVLLAALPARTATAVEDAIIAVVDDDVITAKDLQDYLRGIYSQLRIEGRSDSEMREIMGQYESKGVNQLIEDRLILAEANRQGMQIRPQAVEDRMTEIRKKYPSTQEFLSEINKEGVTISDIRRKVEDQFKARYIVTREVRDKIYVNPQEVTDYYNANLDRYRKRARVYLQSICVKTDFSQGESNAKIQAALEKLKSGADFQAVAREYSELPDIGEVPLDSLNPAFKAVVDTMKPGGVSDAIVTEDGLYILKLAGRSDGVDPSLKKVKEEIYQQLFEEKFKQRFSTWIEGLRKKSYVEIKK